MIDKSNYDSIQIPDDLNDVVQDAIREGTQKRNIHTFSRRLKKTAAAAAVFLAGATVLLNTSSVFAEAAHSIPVVGDFFRIFTFKEYHFEDEIKYINAEIPQIDNTGKTDLEKRINLEIQKIMNDRLAESELRAKEYYEAFVETGGDPEDFIPIGITIDYEVKQSGPHYASFVISQYETAFSAYHYSYYYNIDLKSGRLLTLKEWFGDDYREIVSRSIEASIQDWSEEQKAMLWNDLSVIDLISENTNFYINSKDEAVVVIDKYEAGAGAMGTLEFTITLPQDKEK